MPWIERVRRASSSVCAIGPHAGGRTGSNHEPVHRTTGTADKVDEFAGNLRERSSGRHAIRSSDSRSSGRLAEVWHGPDRAVDVVAAADRLLTDDNAEQYTEAWLGAADLASRLYAEARGRGGHARPARAHPAGRRTDG